VSLAFSSAHTNEDFFRIWVLDCNTCILVFTCEAHRLYVTGAEEALASKAPPSRRSIHHCSLVRGTAPSLAAPHSLCPAWSFWHFSVRCNTLRVFLALQCLRPVQRHEGVAEETASVVKLPRNRPALASLLPVPKQRLPLRTSTFALLMHHPPITTPIYAETKRHQIISSL